MKDYTSTIEKLRELQIGYSGTGMGRILKEGSDAIEELIEEVKRLTEENERERKSIVNFIIDSADKDQLPICRFKKKEN